MDESLCASAPDVLHVIPFPEAFISSAVEPQNCQCIAIPNKHPNCWSYRPAGPSPLPEVSFVENEKLSGLTYELYLAHHWYPQTREQKHSRYKARCHFSFEKKKVIWSVDVVCPVLVSKLQCLIWALNQNKMRAFAWTGFQHTDYLCLLFFLSHTSATLGQNSWVLSIDEWEKWVRSGQQP